MISLVSFLNLPTEPGPSSKLTHKDKKAGCINDCSGASVKSRQKIPNFGAWIMMKAPRSLVSMVDMIIGDMGVSINGVPQMDGL